MVRTQLAEGLPPVQGDRVQLQQRRERIKGVLVEVQDSPGLTPATLDLLFNAFYKTKPGGLGLGLSICRSIVEAHDGRFMASPNVPRGAPFTSSHRPTRAAHRDGCRDSAT